MNTPATASEYLIVFRSADWEKGLSPEEMQDHEPDHGVVRGLAAQGTLKAAQPLFDDGKSSPAGRAAPWRTAPSPSPRK